MSESEKRPETDLTTTESADTAAVVRVVVDSGKSVRRLAYAVLPLLAVLIAAGTVFVSVKYLYIPHRDDTARTESVQAATDGTAKLLTYQPETVRQQLTDARTLTTGAFRNEYTQMTQGVIVGAEQNHISAVTTVPAAASVSATADHAVVLVFINQTVTVGDQTPTHTPTSVRVTLDREGGKWLISGFQTV